MVASRQALFLGALALLACTAFAEDAPADATGSLLIPRNEGDYSNMLTALMETQHSVLQKTHGVDSPVVSLSSSLVSLQTTVSTFIANLTSEYTNFLNFIQTAPSFFTALAADAVLINRQINATLFAISPNLGRSVSLGAPAWVQNKPNLVTVGFTGASAQAQLLNLSPCLIAGSQSGVNVNPVLIQVSPRLIQVDALGVQVQPELITVDPTLINIGPNGLALSPVNINASPSFISVSPVVKVVPNSNKAPTFAAGVAIKPNPDPPSETNQWGVVKAAPSIKLTPVSGK